MLHHLLISLLVGACLCTAVQAQPVASLRSSLTSTPAGPARLDLLLRLSDALLLSAPAEALAHAQEAAELATALQAPAALAYATLLEGEAHLQAGHTRRARRRLEAALPLLRQQPDSSRLLRGLLRLADVHKARGDLERARPLEQEYLLMRQRQLQVRSEARLSVLEEGYSTQQAQTEAARQAEAQARAALEAQTRESLRRELALLQLEQETTALERDKARLERENLRRELQLAAERRRRYWLLGGFLGLGLLALGGWQRQRYLRQKAAATLEKQRAERLQEIDQLKDQFLANTSHELRTPLNGIIGLAEALHDDIETSEPQAQRENLAMIISAGRRLAHLVNDLLDFSRLQHNALELHLRPVDLRALTEVVLRINAPLARNKGLALLNEVPAHLPAALADEDRLQQILHNLIGNAIKFSDEGQVRVMAQRVAGQLEVVVQDTGPGIPAEKQQAIFEAFVQADGSISRHYAGTGLGLPISRQLVTLHQGRMWVESAPGQGARFFFTLPVTAQSPQPLQVRSPVSRPLPPVGAKQPVPLRPVPAVGEERTFRLLVVDDEPINHQVLANHLAGARFEVIHAHSGEEALATLAADPPFHMVLLDIMMPQMSGFEVCQRIRTDHLASELPVIMLTAKNQVEDLVAGLAHGANDYIAKPFSKDELLARIHTHLDLHHINAATARFVPSEFLRALGYQSITDLRIGDQVQRDVTVFFSDIRDYTRLSETMSPAENFGFVRAYARRMGPVIREHGGFVNQYLGDGIMAIFTEAKGDTAAAIRGAIVMQAVLRTYNQQRQAHGRRPLRVGMGLHTGPLIMGIIGDQSRADAATISDTVNIAARMEGLTKYFGANLLVSETTLKALGNPAAFNYRYLGQVQVKGRQQATGVYEFFDADPDYVQALKWATRDTFAAALTAYYGRDFVRAEAGFAEVLSLNADDLPAAQYRALCQPYRQQSPPADWDGVIRPTSK